MITKVASDLPIEPSALKFGKLLTGRTFRVPRYQRAYDWETGQVADFARDVRAIVEAGAGGESSQHFFGAVISIFEPESNFEIVDGQQRLTTHMLCLKELRDRWLGLVEQASRAKKAAIRRHAQERAEALDELIFIDGAPRLSLSKRDREYFNDLMMGSATEPRRGDDQSHKRLWSARKTLREELFEPLFPGPAPYATRRDRLQAAHDALLDKGYVVHLHTKDSSNAYRFFSVLNDRGKPLSAGSLLRTHTLAQLEGYGPQQDGAESDWDAILGRGDPFVNRFLAAYYVSKVGLRVPTGEMFDRFRAEFLNDSVTSSASATHLREKVAELLSEAMTFERIYKGEWPFDKAKKPAWDQDRLRRLVVSLRHHLADPLLLAVAREASEAAFRDLVMKLEPFAFRYINVVSANAARLEGLYFRHAQRVRDTGKLDKTGLRNEMRQILQRHAPDSVFLALLPEQLRFTSKKDRGQLIRHFLTTVEDYSDWFDAGATGKPQPKDRTRVFDLDSVNIEHVYPQHPDNAVRRLEALKHSLGNLTALDQDEGRRAGNKEFADKAAIYRHSEFKITRRLGRLKKWDEAAMARRVEYYSDRAAKIFVVP